jgi:uncharacterized protein YuzE
VGKGGNKIAGQNSESWKQIHSVQKIKWAYFVCIYKGDDSFLPLMRTTYDPEADAMYIYLVEEWPKGRPSTVELDRNVNIDIDKKGNVIGIEILFVKERNLNILNKMPFEEIGGTTVIGEIEESELKNT